MVGPVTTHTEDKTYGVSPLPVGAPEWRHVEKTWQNQRRPYNLLLPFTMQHKVMIKIESTDSRSTLSPNQVWCINDGHWAETLGPAATASWNKAWSKFISELKPAQAELGACIGERKQSMEMVASRATQLARFTGAVAKLRFKDASAILFPNARDARRGFRPASKRASDAFLEYQFGWAPLVGDVVNAVKTLNSGIPTATVRGRGSVKGLVEDGSQLTGPDNLRIDEVVETKWSSSHSIRATVRVTNPDLALANQLGLLNPAFVAWEVIPYSFIVDYFVNVGEYLNGFTDLLGFTLEDTTWTWKATAHSDHKLDWYHLYPYQGYGTGKASWSGSRLYVRREVGPLPGNILAIRWPWQLKPKRAATSVALLLQQLARLKR